MGERLLCKQEVIGSIPFTSTKDFPAGDHGVGQSESETRIIFEFGADPSPAVPGEPITKPPA